MSDSIQFRSKLRFVAIIAAFIACGFAIVLAAGTAHALEGDAEEGALPCQSNECTLSGQLVVSESVADDAVDVAPEVSGDAGMAEECGRGALPSARPAGDAPNVPTVVQDAAANDAVGVVPEPADAALAAADEDEGSYEDEHVNMYRLYNPNSGEHFYTSDIDEATSVASVGWQWEGIGWVAPRVNESPVYRLYNPNAGDHHYTLNLEEKDWLVGLGWNYEGIGWYSDAADQIPVYRQYNPNAIAGAHNFTTDSSEDEYLGSVGWSREGISWYATDGPTVAIAGRWLVTAAWGATERYWIASDGNIAKWRLVTEDEGAGYTAYATGSGAVVRGKYDRGDGYVYVADNDGRLAATSDGADGWLVTDAYDGGLQRYYYVAAERAMRSGFFTVDGGRYFGVGGQGYVLRGKTDWGDHVLLADNDGLMAVGTGWLVTAVYDGELQRYYFDNVWSDYSGARTGLFDVDGNKYYGRPHLGYVARNMLLYQGGHWYEANNDGVLTETAGIDLTEDFRPGLYHGPKDAAHQKYIVLHDTEGGGIPEYVVDGWDSTGTYVAAHFVVGKDGRIVQCVPLDQIAHHAGYGDTGHNAMYGVPEDGRDDMRGTSSIGSWASDYGMNAWSIGIEMIHQGNDPYPEEQLVAVDRLIMYIDGYFGNQSTIIDHKAWRSGNSDTSSAFAGYLANYQDHRTHN